MAAHGFLLGKFLPPTQGHALLIGFARAHQAAQGGRLTVLVSSKSDQEIPGEDRVAWLSAGFPDVAVVHLAEDVPEQPDGPDDARFWEVWRAAIGRLVPQPITHVYASETYGVRLAEELGADFVSVDLARTGVPISATRVRASPLRHWDWLLPAARPHFLKRVCLFGPESTGKSTLAAWLARRYGTVHVPEYARQVEAANAGRIGPAELTAIARGQAAAEAATAPLARRLLLCDTDVLTTTVWSRFLLGTCPAWMEAAAAAARYDLTLLLDVDCPWVDDGTRFLGAPETRARFFAACRAALESAGRSFVVLRGSWGERTDGAVAALEAAFPELAP